MGKVYKHPAVKLIVGFIFKEDLSFTSCAGYLKRKFGPIDFESPSLDFNLTDYYEKEFGIGLKRKFLGTF